MLKNLNGNRSEHFQILKTFFFTQSKMHAISKSLVSVIASASVSFFVYKTFQIYRMRKRYEHIPGPPTPPGILGFYLGNLQKIAYTMSNGKLLADLMIEWYENIYLFFSDCVLSISYEVKLSD